MSVGGRDWSGFTFQKQLFNQDSALHVQRKTTQSYIIVHQELGSAQRFSIPLRFPSKIPIVLIFVFHRGGLEFHGPQAQPRCQGCSETMAFWSEWLPVKGARRLRGVHIHRRTYNHKHIPASKYANAKAYAFHMITHAYIHNMT